MPNMGDKGNQEGDILVHEVGHHLGLEHTFEGGCTNPNDFVDDTPACVGSPGVCSGVVDSCPKMAGNDDITNYMDYNSDSCIDHFTTGQRDRMFSQITAYRPAYLTNPHKEDPEQTFPSFSSSASSDDPNSCHALRPQWLPVDVVV
eukprot:TRINITY_DN8832_c0_g1_i1.p1 TRINITY_DN8832_c0_g1~~TRINITY_DN8832_c0_g1_i1.p1  ORF type:complete len:146 (-),score=18.82 TRINITY_DN8832_c0_g1_i1:47-484(-)